MGLAAFWVREIFFVLRSYLLNFLSWGRTLGAHPTNPHPRGSQASKVFISLKVT